MKERIIGLAEQAGLEYNFDPMLWLKYEKFAELIVKECAGVCNDARDSTDFVTIAGITDYCAKAIMERFGVEE